MEIQDDDAEKALSICLAHKYWELNDGWPMYKIILGSWETPFGNVCALNNAAESGKSLKMGSQDLCYPGALGNTLFYPGPPLGSRSNPDSPFLTCSRNSTSFPQPPFPLGLFFLLRLALE